MNTRQIILASTSPRRKEVLSKLGVPFEVVASDYEEDMTLPLPPEELVAHLSQGKTDAVAKAYPEAIVIGADTIVSFEGEVLGKPRGGEAEAREMLRQLSGKTNEIITGVTIQNVSTNTIVSFTESTQVVMRELSDELIDAYIATGEPMDKAGAYAIQEKGALLVERIDGDFHNAMGLPLRRLAEELESTLGVSVWSS